MKNIIICCDGTQNQLDGYLTNVVRLFEVALKDKEQVAFYDPGVGTMADSVLRTRVGKRWSLIKGLAFGSGLAENVTDAYRYLMRTYEDGDKVFLFGFSRGSFTVRVLAGMLHGVGLLHRGSENLLPYVWRHYRGIKVAGTDADESERKAAADYDAATALLRRSFTRPCPVAFLGPWDTVGSVGMYGMNQAFAFTFENPSVAIVRQAVALDERRAGFRGNMFKSDATEISPKRPRVMNVWFPGVHSDIGGGYPWNKQDSGLAMIAFAWMVREAKAAGLKVDDAKVAALLAECPPNPMAKKHASLTWPWWALMEFLPVRRFNWATRKMKIRWPWQGFKPRTMIESPILHQSVKDRMAGDSNYRPPNLPPNHNFPTEDNP